MPWTPQTGRAAPEVPIYREIVVTTEKKLSRSARARTHPPILGFARKASHEVDAKRLHQMESMVAAIRKLADCDDLIFEVTLHPLAKMSSRRTFLDARWTGRQPVTGALPSRQGETGGNLWLYPTSTRLDQEQSHAVLWTTAHHR